MVDKDDLIHPQEGKGKGKDPVRSLQDADSRVGGSDTAGAPGQSTNRPLPARILDSALRLPSALTTAPGATEDLQRGTAGASNKAQAGPSGSRAPTAQTVAASSSPAVFSTAREGFRSGPLVTMEQEFSTFLDSVPPTEFDFSNQEALPGFGNQPGWGKPIDPLASQTVEEQESRDGEMVVALLDNAWEDPIEDNMGPDSLSPDEIASLRLALFGSRDSDAGAAAGAIKDFWPDLTRDQGKGPRSGPGSREDSFVPNAQSLNSWKVVLERYNADVWGPLEPLVEQAREEIARAASDTTNDETPAETPAIRRLRLILGHIRNS